MRGRWEEEKEVRGESEGEGGWEEEGERVSWEERWEVGGESEGEVGGGGRGVSWGRE